jgi:hypothetical protein
LAWLDMFFTPTPDSSYVGRPCKRENWSDSSPCITLTIIDDSDKEIELGRLENVTIRCDGIPDIYLEAYSVDVMEMPCMICYNKMYYPAGRMKTCVCDRCQKEIDERER